MYHIGVINQGYSENELTSYIQALESDDFLLVEANEQMTKDELLEKDVILLFAEYVNTEVMNVCSMILQLRSQTDALIWVYRKSTDKTERVVYLQLGADLNLSEDCSPEEMQQLLINTLNRQKTQIEVEEEKEIFSHEKPLNDTTGFRLNENNLSVILNDREISLTRKEYGLMCLLKSHAGEAITYQEIYKTLWPLSSESQLEKHTYRVANIVFRVREKLEKNRVDPNCVRTVRSIGYMLDTVQLEKEVF